MVRFALFCLVLSAICSHYQVESERILCVSHQFASHMMLIHSTVEGLIKNGHEVYTIYSDVMPVPKGLEEKGFKVLKYHTPGHGRIMSDPEEEAKILDEIFNATGPDHAEASRVAEGECIDMDNDKHLEKQLFDLKFDLVIVDIFVPCKCMSFLPLKLKVPFVLLAPSLEMEATRIPLLPSFVPVGIFLLSDNMSFSERLYNTLFTTIMSVPAMSPFPAVRNTDLLEKYNDDPDVATWDVLARKAQLHLIPRGGIVEYPIPWNPNVINIECLTCKPGKPLSGDVGQLADSSEGVIVVSFGSLITRFPDEIAEKFLAAFARRKELVFWRYKAKLPGKVPPNVRIMKWLPQNDLLAHPKTKLFITHSGNNGQYESVYHGVPMLAFPLFAEQHHNAHRITVHGYGLESKITSFSVKELSEKMDRIISEPSFRQKTQHASRILKSMPMNAQDTATFWIEHILKFGSEHLKSHALDMPWYSFYMFDVIVFLEIIIAVVIVITLCSISFVYRKLISKKSHEKIKKN